MKKLKIGPSIFLLILFCLLTHRFILMLNYILALTLHELAHLFVASNCGYSLKLIKLDVFGLSVELNEKIDDKDSFKINVAGPVFNLLLCLICVSSYWLFPTSFIYLNQFCFCNLILAVFNLLPIYPLDGGKIFRGIIKSDKSYRVLDCLVRSLLAGLSVFMFIGSCFNIPNLMFLLLAVFFIFSKGRKVPTMSIFKYRTNKHFDKVVILKIAENETLFNMIKQIKSHHYTIFYVPKQNKYFDEDLVITLSLRNPLTTQIKDAKT